MDMVASVLLLLAGIGVFLVACNMLSSNLESICSSRLRDLFARASDKKLVGVGVGTVATAAIQSSGATTVLVIGFVNAGIMSLTLAAAVIYGANIGTTVTAQIVAWGGSFSLESWFGALACVGAFIAAYAKKTKTKSIGAVIAAFGMLFVALALMKDAMSSFAGDPGVQDFLGGIDNVIILVILGAALTALIQSSSVMTAVIISMLGAGMIDLNQGIYLAMGSNIGSCIVAILAGFTSGTNAKRTALIHLLFNVFGVIIFMVAGLLVNYGEIFGSMFQSKEIDLAMFHTLFNVITVIIMLPLTSYLIRIVTRIIPDKKVEEEEDAPRLRYVDEHMLKTPAIAIGEVKNEIINMADVAIGNFNRACRIITTLDFTEADEFKRSEKQLNYTNKQLTRFLTKLSRFELNATDTAYVAGAFHNITDLERVGDYAENIVEYAEKLQSSGESFSDQAKAEIDTVREAVNELYGKCIEAYKTRDREVLKQAHLVEQRIDDLTSQMEASHITRLSDGVCTVGVGTEFLAMSSDIERIADHVYNVGKSIKEVNKATA